MRCYMLLAALPLLAAPANAQTGGLSSLLGGGLPNIGKVGVGNAAGVITYCVKNNYLSGSNSSALLGKLTGQKGVSDSPGYTAGKSGVIQAGDQAVPLTNVQGQLKTKLCKMVLKQGAHWAGR